MADEKNAPAETPDAKAQLQSKTEAEPAEVKMPSEAFKKRLDEQSESTKRAMLKKYGFESEAALERRLKALKDIEESQLSEQEKLKKRVEELEPAAQRAKDLEERYAKQITKQVEALPDNLKKIVSERADGPEEIEALLEIFAEAGMLNASAASTAGAVSTGGATTAPSAKAPKQGDTPSKYDEWKKLDSNPATRVLGGLFYNNHAAEIERDRPAPTG